MPTPKLNLDQNPEFRADLENPNLTNADIVNKWHCGNGYVGDRRARLKRGEPIDPTEAREAGQAPPEVLPESHSVDFEGNHTIEKVAERIIPLSEWLDDLRKDGFDPDDFETSHSHSVWMQHTRDQVTKVLYANKFIARKRPQKVREALVSHAEVMEAIRTFHFIPSERAFQDAGFILMPTDLQTGKVDIAGGTAETAEQVLTSFSKAAEIIKEERPRQVAMVDAGDVVENVFNTSAQLGTNDRDLPHQVVEAMALMQKGIQMLAPHCSDLRYAAVSSNHGAFRVGPKAPAGDAHADYGIAVAKLLGIALELNPAAFGHVTVQVPKPHMESLAFDIAGTRIGAVHSHQASSADKISEWWKGQALGRLPVADADFLLAGHWHSLRVQQAGDGRWIFVGPSSDRGSSWFTNLKGDQATSGMLSFFTADKQWWGLDIL
ncbi:hypothetical protein MRBLMI12_000495 [Microbacterium sp. LMI12-1-1.1]|uniref:hypothetical protein n=1 Tax=Microbacterium sp. LMI12-1-1.1 TaxID=3135225 RepID=UPI00344248A3